MVVTGTAIQSGSGRTYAAGILEPSRERSAAILVDPVSGDDASPDAMHDRIAVLASDGILAFTTHTGVYAIKTHLSGLANTRHPRTLWAGNDARGYVEPIE